MYPLPHLISGIIFSLILFFIFPQINLIGSFIIVISTVLIDIDHYIYFIYKKKDWNLKNAYDWSIEVCKKFSSLPKTQRNKFYSGFCFLHGIEILIILIILGILVSKYFLFIFIGFLFHLFSDVIYQIVQRERVDKLSLVHDFLKFRKLKLIEPNGRK